MGAVDDPMAVVDSQGRVIGAENLHIADASIMPDIVRANTNATAVMIGEMMADKLKAASGCSSMNNFWLNFSLNGRWSIASSIGILSLLTHSKVLAQPLAWRACIHHTALQSNHLRFATFRCAANRLGISSAAILGRTLRLHCGLS